MVGPREVSANTEGFWYPYAAMASDLRLPELCGSFGHARHSHLEYRRIASRYGRFVDYVNGDTTSTWGARRGGRHPAPYDVHRIELGNETADDEPSPRVQRAGAAIGQDPAMVLTIGDMSYHHVISIGARDRFRIRPDDTRVVQKPLICRGQGGHSPSIYTPDGQPEQVSD